MTTTNKRASRKHATDEQIEDVATGAIGCDAGRTSGAHEPTIAMRSDSTGANEANVVCSVSDPLTRDLVPIASLIHDPANVRLHSPRNIEAIKASLVRFKQQKPIVIDANGVVIAGNGTLAAAKSLGWTHIAAVRSGLSPHDRVAFAIADNRTAELAEWDDQALGKVLANMSEDLRFAAGFSPDEMPTFDSDSGPILGGGAEDEGASRIQGMQFKIIIDCDDEAHQKTLIGEFEQNGITCRPLIA